MTSPLPSASPTPFEAAQSLALSQALPLYRNALACALAGEASPRRAIRAKCLECVGYARSEVTECTAYGCPLWRLRPYQAPATRL
jgi:hypothetical protein